MTAVESVESTAVIDVPMRKGMFWVAGSQCSEPVLKERGQYAGPTVLWGG